MEFGIFLNGYIPGPAAHDTELEHRRADPRGRVRDLRRQAQLEVRLVRRAPRAHRVQPHVGARGRHGLRRRADRLHPPRHRHHEPLAAQGAPGPLRRARRDARPLHRTTGSSGAPAAAPAATRSPAFNILDKDSTKAEWDEVVREIPRMWEQVDYTHHGRALHRADTAQHPAEAVRQGPPADLGRVRQPADVRQGRRARHRRDRVQLRADLQPAGPHRGLQGRRSRSAPSRSASSRTTT